MLATIATKYRCRQHFHIPSPTITIAIQHYLMGYVNAIGDVLVCRMTVMLLIEDGGVVVMME